MAAVALTTLITTYPGSTLVTLTLANTAYRFLYPTGVPISIMCEPHANAASVHDEAADAATVVPADGSVIAAGGSFVWEAGQGDRFASLPQNDGFSLASASAGTKVLIRMGPVVR